MATMDIFNRAEFSMMELTRGLESVPYTPGLIRSLGLFDFRSIRQRQFAIESRDGVLTLIDFSDPDAPATQTSKQGEERTIRDFRTRHFKKEVTIRASEVAGIREFGKESELQQVQNEVARRGKKLRTEAELTFEFHMLNALQGRVLRTDGTRVVYNWYTEFGITEAAPVYLDLTNETPAKGALRKALYSLITSIEEDVGGLVPGTLTIEAVCGKQFYEDLTSHPEVIEAYLYAQKIADLSGKPLDVFEWGGVRFRRYRGGAGVGVHPDKCHFYPVGIDGLFEQYASPVEDFDFVNTPGQEVYYRPILDRDRNSWIKIEAEANPMFVCTRPKVLRTGNRNAPPAP